MFCGHSLIFFSPHGSSGLLEITCVFRKLKLVENKVEYRFKKFMLDVSPEDPGSTVCFDRLQATCVSVPVDDNSTVMS